MSVIFLSDVRISFPHIADPQKTKDEKTGETRIAYGADFIMPADHPGFAQVMRRIGELALEHGKEHSAAVMNMINADRKSRCFGRGEEKVNKKTFTPYDGHAGNVYLTASAKKMPQMVDGNGAPVPAENTMLAMAIARKIYGGCRVNVALKPWWQQPNAQKQYGHGVRCDLVALQFLRDDKPFGEGAPDVTGMFGAVAQAPAAPAAPAAAMGMPPFLLGQT
jgi:hypothetical protein